MCPGVQVSRKVYHILKLLRDVSKHRKLWIDQLCIDQDNNDEKSSQVTRMRDIFQNAQTVVAVLSSDSHSPLFPTRKYEKALKFISSKRSRFSLGSQLKPSDSEQSDILALLDDPWFSRIWIVQEVAYSQNVQFVCDSTSIDGKHLVDIRSTIRYDRPRSDLRKRMDELDIFFNFMLQGPKLRQNTRLLEVMQRFRSWDATDPRDKIYALLGLSVDGTVIEPNYNLSAADVFEGFARMIQAHKRSLDILSYGCLTAGVPQLAHIPSWCPDWTSTQRYPRAPATPSRPLGVEFIISSYQPQRLVVQGYPVAHIRSIFSDRTVEITMTELWAEAYSTWPWANLSRYLKDLSQMMHNEAESGLATGDIICVLIEASGLAILRPRSPPTNLDATYNLVWLQSGQFEPIPNKMHWNAEGLVTVREIDERVCKVIGGVSKGDQSLTDIPNYLHTYHLI